MSLLTKQQQKFSLMLGKLLLYANLNDLGITMGEAWRSEEEQERLYKAGFSKIKNYGHHQKRLAIDLYVFINNVCSENRADYKRLADYWLSLDTDNVWGGVWTGGIFGKDGDYHHFQYTK